jgi:hypothetical protein
MKSAAKRFGLPPCHHMSCGEVGPVEASGPPQKQVAKLPSFVLSQGLYSCCAVLCCAVFRESTLKRADFGC